MTKTKIIVTLGPSTNKEEDLRKLKDRGVDFVRVNMSHSSIESLRYFLKLAKKVGIPFIIDTEGSQIRSGILKGNTVSLEENDEVLIYKEEIVGDKTKICLKPSIIINQLEPGDLLHLDFDTLILRVSDISMIDRGYIKAKTISAGVLGSNKGVVIDPVFSKKFDLPPFSNKDYESIKIGLENNIKYIAVSFVRSGLFIDEARRATDGRMKIISKIECTDALENLDEIIDKTDFLLIDRGDLSKEIPIEKIPLAQKVIIQKAKKIGKDVFVATNLLETMITQKKPTRAEAHDVIATIIDGASGLTLAAETAIGSYPMECVNMLNKLISQAEFFSCVSNTVQDNQDSHKSDSIKYLLDDSKSALVAPHGGLLVNRVATAPSSQEYLAGLPKIYVNSESQMDIEQISIGTFSPLEGFLCQKDFISVLDNMRLANGVIWPLPIVLDVNLEDADKCTIGEDIGLVDDNGDVFALLNLEEKYKFDKDELAQKLYGTIDKSHSGVQMVYNMKPLLLGGKITLLKRRDSETKEYDFTPRQIRRLFSERGWSKIVGFHTRNVIHKSHEFIQLKALNEANCDGLFIHPVVGKKKAGDFNARYIIGSYEIMIKYFYPKDKVLFATFPTSSHYAGPREALFTAICRKNFGCSHFIIGRDHTGVGNFYPIYASHDIFDQFPDLGMQIIKFGDIFYSQKAGAHMHADRNYKRDHNDQLNLSGTLARKMLMNLEKPPRWFMRPKISNFIIKSIKNGEEVFVKNQITKGKVIWFTGLSGSGKTTVAKSLKNKLNKLGKTVEILDGDIIRNTIHKKLSFSRTDIRTNNLLIAKLAQKKSLLFDYVLVPVISPFREDRALSRKIIGDNFIELFIDCPIRQCVKRDPKGLYKKAICGQLNNVIGFSKTHPYEAPIKPHIHLKTNNLSLSQCIKVIVQYLKINN